MDNDERLFIAIEKLQETVSNLRSDLKVMNAKQEELLHKYIHQAKRGDEFAERLRSVESAQALHKGYFAILGAGLIACISVIVKLLI